MRITLWSTGTFYIVIDYLSLNPNLFYYVHLTNFVTRVVTTNNDSKDNVRVVFAVGSLLKTRKPLVDHFKSIE